MTAESVGGASVDFTVNDKSEAAFVQMERNATRAERTIVQAAGNASAAGAGIGAGMSRSAAESARATKSMAANLERLITTLKAGERGTADFYQALAKSRGADSVKLAPLIAEFRQLKEAEEQAAKSAIELAQKRAAATATVAANRQAFDSETASREAYLAKLREEVKLLGMSEAARRAYKAAQANKDAGGGSEGEALLAQLERIRAAQERAAKAARDRADAERAAAVTQSGNDAFVASLKRQSEAIGKTRADLLEMEAAQRGLSAQAAPFIAKLRESEKGLQGVGVSAGQTAAAMRQLPAQFTDIATQLAGGQSPLLILLQQGGQIKDSFGGIGNAARSIGPAIVKELSSPVGIAVALAAAVAAVVGVFEAGRQESSALQKQLGLTGNAAGLTEGSFNSLARTLAQQTNTSIGETRDVLKGLVADGRLSEAAMTSVARAALNFAKATGISATDAATKFLATTRNIASGAAELNSQYGFLNAAQLQYIKNLQEQGEISKATTLVFDQLGARAATQAQNLGTLEKAWNAVGKAISGAWDALKGIGRADTLDAQISAAEKALKALDERQSSNPLAQQTGRRREAIKGLLDDLKQAQLEERRLGERTGQSTRQNQLAEEARKVLEGSRSSAEKLNNELTNTRKLLENAGIPAPQIERALEKITNDAAATQQQRATSAADAQAQFAVRSAKLAADLDKINADAAAGILNEYQAIDARGDNAVKQLQAQKLLTQQLLSISNDKLENDAEQRALAGQIAALDVSIGAARVKVESDVAAAIRKRQLAAEAAYQADRDQSAQEIAAAVAADASKRDALILSIREQGLALQDSNAELALEASLIGQSSEARSAALQQLRIRLQLERDLEKIRSSNGRTPSERADAESGAKSNAQKALDQVASKATVDYLADLLDPTRAKTFGEALTDAFDGAGNSLVKLTNLLQDYGAQQRRINAARDQISKEKDPAKRLKLENDLIEAQGQLQISTYAQMAGAAKGFFDENSRGYKALHAAETAFQAFQLASDLVKGVSAAAVGIANQAQGDPYTAFPRMAAMAAAMAALGFATGFLGNSGGGTQATAAQRQGGAATGRVVTPDQLDRNSPNFRGGTVFGNDEARSESIAKSIDMLEKHSRLELDYSRGQLSALEAIRDNLAGVANLVVRSAGGGLTTGKNLGIQTGVIGRNRGDPGLNALGVSPGTSEAISKVVAGIFTFGVGSLLVEPLQKLWGKTKQDITDSGLSIVGTVADLSAGRGVEQFADVKTTTSSFFGLKKKTTENTVFANVDEQIAQQFSLIFQSIGETVKASAAVLGREGGDALAQAIASFPVAIERLSLKDLKGDELQDAISAAIGAQADTIAQALVPGLEAFRTVGEGYFETLVKVSSGIEVAKYQLDLLGVSAIAYTDVIRKQGDVGAEIVRQSIAAAETAGGALSSVGAIVNTLSGTAEDLADTYRALVDVRTALVKVGQSGETLTTAMIRGAGGLDKLSSSLDTYFTEFFSPQEQLAANAGALRSEFEKLGLQLPVGRTEFRELVTALNDGTDAGAAMAAKVLGLAGAFDEVADAAEEAASRLTDAITESLTRFGTPQERQGSTFGKISADLQRDAGVSFSIGQLMGATKQDIEAFARAFLAVSTNSDAAKTAVLNAANALADLKDEASGKRGSLEIELLRAQGRELEAVNLERQAELAQLVALESSLGVAAGTFTKIQTEIYAAADATAALTKQQNLLSGLSGVIADFLKGNDLAQFRAQQIQSTLARGGVNVSTEQIIGATTKGIVELWNSVGDAGKQAILDSYGALTTLQTDFTKQQRKALDDQLAGMKGLRDLAKDIKQFISTVKFGDLSPLSAEAQLSEARSLFDTTFTAARGGDTKAQGNLLSNAQAYLQELQSAFASGPAFTAEFNRVTSMLEALGLQGDSLDPQIKYLESLSDNSRQMLDALLAINDTLKGGTTQGIGDRTFVTGPNGSSGGLSGEVDLSPVRRSDAAGPGGNQELLEKVLAKLDEILASTKEGASAAGGTAGTAQIGFKNVTEAVNGVRDELAQIKGNARSAASKDLALSGARR